MICAGTQEGEEDQTRAGWDARPAVLPGAAPSFPSKRPYPQTLIAGPSLLPLPTPPQPPASLADPSGFHGVVPTSSGGGVAGTPVDWAQLQVQMQMLSQSNPMFYTQMQQFFWSQNMMQMQQQAAVAAAAAQGYVPHLQQQQPGTATGATGHVPSTADFTGAAEGDYNMAGGAAAAQYLQMASTGGLFIPPMAHIPSTHHHHMPEETDTSQHSQQTPRRSLAIPIVPPKVYTHHKYSSTH